MATKAAARTVPRTLEEDRDFVKILYYGDPGTGKTTHLAQLARLGPVEFVDAESGIKRAAMEKREVPLKEITVNRAITFDRLEELFFDLKGRLDDDPDAIAGVVLDSLTEIQKKLLEVIVKESVERTHRKGQERSNFEIYKEDWGVNTEQLRQIVRKFRDLNCHVGFACLSRRDQDDDGAVIYGPALTPALQTDLIGYVDVICHTSTMLIPRKGAKGEYDEMFLGTFRRAGKYFAKDRYSLLPRTLVNPTFDRVVQYIEGTLTEAEDEVQKEGKARFRAEEVAEEKETAAAAAKK